MKIAPFSRQAVVTTPGPAAVCRPAARCLRSISPQQLQLLPASKPSLGLRSVVTARAVYGSEWSTPRDAYLAIGLAHCYEKGDDGVIDRFLIEPIPANALESMVAGAKTCFKAVYGMTLGDALARSKAALPPEFAEATFCEEFEARCDACARTWMRPHAIDNLLQIVPLGQVKSGFVYDTTDKRIINAENVVNDDDNVKQDMSIDVYGRKPKDGEKSQAAGGEAQAEQQQQQEEEEDDMDSLLAA